MSHLRVYIQRGDTLVKWRHSPGRWVSTRCLESRSTLTESSQLQKWEGDVVTRTGLTRLDPQSTKELEPQ